MSMICTTRPSQAGTPTNLDIRHPALSEAPAFGALLLDAYHGTVDYEGEDLADSIAAAKEFMSGDEFSPIWEACFSVIEQNRMRCISFVADFEGTPLLVVSATENASKRTGLASGLIELSLDALHKLGRPTLRLYVTATNTPAIKAYEKLGFTPE